nr:FAD-binding oxidoreductase [Marinicella sp. W31]MDC2875508.1 FAD-binding oxidoreductase [Marinicella sp. W31]
MQVNEKRPGSKPFDPQYDPLMDRTLGPGSDYAPTYWIGTAGELPEDDGPVTGDIDVDAVVIGSGYTGLSTAIHLAKMHGIKATVLEANGVAYGCSTRNGGQAQISAGRLKRSQWIDRWDLQTARAMHDEMVGAFDLFRGLVRDHAIACEPQDGGHYYIAHKASAMPGLEAESRVLNDKFGYGSRMLSREEVLETVARDMEAHGAMWEPDGAGIHAAKLAFGYLRVARELGAKVHIDSPVQVWEYKDGIHHLKTPRGTVRAKRVAVATAAYAPRGLHPRVKDRLLPIMSNSVVTRVLTDDELQSIGIKMLSPLTDTRTLRNYYRLLPDSRLQIGSRAAITGRDAENPAHLKGLCDAMARKFPR